MLSQDTRGEKNEFLYLLTYRLPEEMSGGNFVTDLASFPKYFGKSKQLTLNPGFLKSDFGSWYLSDFILLNILRHVYFYELYYSFFFSLQWFGSDFCSILAVLRAEMSLHVLLFLPLCFLPVTFHTSGWPASCDAPFTIPPSVHFIHISYLHTDENHSKHPPRWKHQTRKSIIG